MRRISIANDFTPFPGGRYKKHGSGSGEEFRETLLIPALRSRTPVLVNIDGAAGYPSSFLEEAFGGLIRRGFDRNQIRQLVKIEASAPYAIYRDLILRFIDEAAKRAQMDPTGVAAAG